MSRPAKKRQLSLEISISWAAGCLLLLVANLTIFRQLDASVGDPWFNYTLAVLILVQCLFIGKRLYRLHGEVVHANSQIDRVDGFDDCAFAEYIGALCEKDGWNVRPGDIAAPGASLYLEKAETRIQLLLHNARRKLTGDYVASAVSFLGEHPRSAGETELWCITNTSFTDRARRTAGEMGIRLVDRKELIRRLARSGSAPFIHEAGRRK